MPLPFVVWKESNDYVKGARLGDGGFAEVYQATERGSNVQVALKCLQKGDDPQQRQNALNEFNFQKGTQSLHVLGVYDVAIVENKPCVVMELGTEGSVRNWLKQRGRDEGNPGFLKPHEAKPIVKQMLLGIKALHDANVVHRDIKPSNFLLVGGVVKITDFGLAVYTDERSTEREKDRRRGTKGFRAPEMYEYDPVTNLKALDIYSMGVSMWQVLGGLRNPLYYDRDDINLSPLQDDLVYRMTDHNPDARPTIDEVLADPWLHDDDSVEKDDVVREWLFNSELKQQRPLQQQQHPFSVLPMTWQNLLISWM
jgi:serine/threonine protein kinase